MRDAFIGLHAAGGIVAFLAGLQLIRVSGEAQGRRRLYTVFAAALATMIVFVAAAIIVDWPSLATVERWVFCGLLVLALYMAYRALLGWRRLREHPDGQDSAYVEHVGFNLISLFIGLVVVSVIDLDAPVWLAVLVAVISVIAGRRLVAIAKVRASGGA